MTKEEPPSPAKAADREAKLAQALRANLRRRKTAPQSASPERPLADVGSQD